MVISIYPIHMITIISTWSLCKVANTVSRSEDGIAALVKKHFDQMISDIFFFINTILIRIMIKMIMMKAALLE